MLILTRLLGQQIVIGENVTVTVLPGSRGQVKLGIDAPLDVSIHRGEVFKRIQAEQKKAANDG